MFHIIYLLIIYCMYNHSEFIRPFIFSVKKRCFPILSSHGRIMIHGFVESRHLCECQISIGPVIAPKNTSQILTVQLNEINLVVKSALRDLDVARIVVCSFPMHPRFFLGVQEPVEIQIFVASDHQFTCATSLSRDRKTRRWSFDRVWCWRIPPMPRCSSSHLPILGGGYVGY